MTSQPRLLLFGVALLATLTALTIGLAAWWLDPPSEDLIRLAIFLPVSGGVSLIAGVSFTSLYQGMALGGIRGKLLTAVALSVGLVIVNVAFTSYLMFLSSHDLTLLSLLMLFALVMAGYFALIVAGSFHETVERLLAGVRSMGEGRLQTRIDIASHDELAELAQAFNMMAGRLEEAFARQNELEEARRHLIGAVSHDLRTPLATMRAMVESINDGVVSDPETIERYHHTMQSEIAYLSRLIDDLFELSQIDSGMLELRPESGNIRDLISGTLEALEPQAKQRELTLQGDVDGHLPSILMDVPRMQRVLYNLVQNALRHTPPDGSVVIRAVDVGSEIEISVQDTGEGVDAAELSRIFERFYRGDRARTRDQAGSGLGLTIAKGIVELHGGRIWAKSDRGQGATFVFTVPKTTHA